MALTYLGSVLKSRGHKVTIYNASLGPIINTGGLYRYGASEEETKEFIARTPFDLVGITCAISSQWKFTAALAKQVKDVSSKAIVAVGGLYPTYHWKECLGENTSVDVIFLGEAELSFAEFVDHLSCGQNLAGSCQPLDGVAWKSQGQIYHNPKTEYNHHLDSLPFPDWHLIDLEKQFSVQKKLIHLPARSLPILSSRSCPNRCSFCNMYITHGSRWRPRSAENVVQEIDYLIKEFNINYFYFIDDNFSFDNARAKRICRLIIEQKLRIRYTFPNGLSIKTIDKELVELMKASGCLGVCLAVESGSNRIRNEIYKKNLKEEDVLRVCRLFHEFKIPTQVFFMIGAPTETEEDVNQTKKLIARLPMDLASVSVYTPYPGTALYEQCLKNGWISENPLEEADTMDFFSPVLQMKNPSPNDVRRWQLELYMTFLTTHFFAVIRKMFSPESILNLENFLRFTNIVKHHCRLFVSSLLHQKPAP